MTTSLLIAPQWIGDAVMTEPLLRRLQASGERVSVGALPWVAPVYRAMPTVAEVIEFPFAHGGLQWAGRRAMARHLRGRFDVAYVAPNSLKSALIPWWACIPLRVGYTGESRWGLINQRLPNPPKGERPPMVPFYSALADAAKVRQDPASPHSFVGDEAPQLTLPVERRDAVLQAHGLVAQSYAVFAPGAEYGPAKRWPAKHFAALAAQLPFPVLLLGSGKEAALCDDIGQQVQGYASGGAGRVRNLAGKTTLDEAIALIAGARVMVSNDSGLMHVAAAFGVRQVAIFGSSSPLHTPPLNRAATVLWLKNEPDYQPPLGCAPCFQRECPLGHTRCLHDVTPERVLAQVLAA